MGLTGFATTAIKSKNMRKCIAILAIAITVFYPGFAGSIKADVEFEAKKTNASGAAATTAPKPAPTKRVWLTAYSSSVDETDDTPFITASGKAVRDGIVATNGLAFGTKIKIPSVFGDKIFVVEDRMHRRKVGIVDIWMPSKKEALKFGAFKADIVILPNEAISVTTKERQTSLLVEK